MNPLIECIGFDASTLDAAAVEKVNTLIASQPEGDVMRVELYPNFDATSEENLPSGMMVFFSPQAKVDPTLLSDNLFQAVAVSKIIPQQGQTVNDAFFEGMGENVLDAVQQFPEQPVSGKVHNKYNNQEIKQWAPELGGSDAFVGVYSKLREDHRTKDFYVVGRATAPLYVQDVKRHIASAKDTPTYAQLMDNAEWCDFMGAAELASRRNLYRNMQNVAESCGVEIMRADDVFNGATYENPDLAAPELAVPEWMQPTHSIRKTALMNQPAVAVSYGVVPMEHCLKLEDQHFFVVANPYDGISVFDMTKHEDMLHHAGLPADTGRTQQPENISLNVDEYTDRIQGIVWERAENAKLVGAEHHVDLHSDAFRKVDRSFKHCMRHMGWNPEDHVERMVCVVAKIYNPEMRRK